MHGSNRYLIPSIITIIKKKNNFMAPTTLTIWGESFPFTKKSPHDFMLLIWSISENWKAESTLETPSVFQPMFFNLRHMDSLL